MQYTHKNKSDNRMIEIPVYIVLHDKTGELHIEPFITKHNISHRMEVSTPRKSPLCISEVLSILLSECP